MEDHPSEGRAGSRSWRRPALVALGVAAIGVGAYAVTASGDDPTSQRQAPDLAGGQGVVGTVGELEPLVVREGDEVQAVGMIVDGPGDALLCRTNPVPAVAYVPGTEPPPTCSALAVPLAGTEDLTLPAWTERDDVWFTAATVVVNGTWGDGAIVVTQVDEAPLPDDDLDDGWWEVPCAPPAGGWGPGDGMPTDVPPEQQEAAMVPFWTEMEAHPERYHMRWTAYPEGDPMKAPTNDMGEPQFEHTVMMVSTVDDPAEVHAALAAIYPGNLCVMQVQHSLAELETVVERLASEDDGWALNSSSLGASADNRATLELPVLDEEGVTRTGDDADLLEVRPLVRPVS